MVVAVQRPAKKDDPFDKILKGVQLASGILGLKQQIDTEMAPKQDPNALTQKDILASQQSGKMEFGSEPSEGAQKYITADGTPIFGKAKAPTISPDTEANIASKEKLFGLELDQKNKDYLKKLSDATKNIESENRKTRTKQEQQLRSEYEKAGAKETLGSLRGFKKVQAAAMAENPSGADDVALIFGYMKTLDPGSTVREGEFATVEQTEGVPGRVVNLYNNLISGQRLNTEQRKGFLVSAARQLGSQLDVQKTVDERFTGLAKRSEADVEDVINPEFTSAMEVVQGILKQGGSFNLSGGGTTVLPGETTATGADNFDNRDTLLNELGGQ